MELFLQGLTQFTEDVIVDAANQQLEHSTGLAKAIADAGRPLIQLECPEHVGQHGNLKPGQVYMSSPGSLSCKKVIHAVIPIWNAAITRRKKSPVKLSTNGWLLPTSTAFLRLHSRHWAWGIEGFPSTHAPIPSSLQ
ncbi:hypothetical protein NP493_1756g00003 [Ridgeia piscesae]|uniref:Macro domain-containing protein n=1 Tax=Ridgeia piscesae TaxID=27915 RepID=A0AAD9N9D4_RIDPI|nr:hypothetical protein NP493_1756g00003 [Ridgeia piscesae]